MTTAAVTTNVSVTSASAPGRGLNIALWIAQVLLAIVFGLAGAMKVFTPIDVLSRNMSWVKDAQVLIRFIGVSELAGMLGILLPSITRIRPKLTSLAAVGLFIVMLLATGFHVSKGELSALPVTLGLGALSAFVAWGRFRRAPIRARAMR
jgi:uncharacterized membrane protein YphA (DoxX/SURF4 family)